MFYIYFDHSLARRVHYSHKSKSKAALTLAIHIRFKQTSLPNMLPDTTRAQRVTEPKPGLKPRPAPTPRPSGFPGNRVKPIHKYSTKLFFLTSGSCDTLPAADLHLNSQLFLLQMFTTTDSRLRFYEAKPMLFIIFQQ